MFNFQLEPVKVLLLQCYSPTTKHIRGLAVYLPLHTHQGAVTALILSWVTSPFMSLTCQERQEPYTGGPFQLSVLSLVVIYHT